MAVQSLFYLSKDAGSLANDDISLAYCAMFLASGVTLKCIRSTSLLALTRNDSPNPFSISIASQIVVKMNAL